MKNKENAKLSKNRATAQRNNTQRGKREAKEERNVNTRLTMPLLPQVTTSKSPL